MQLVRKMYRRKTVITVLIILGCLATVILAAFSYLKPFKGKGYSGEDFGMEPYTSTIDHDNDGIDDQTDILISAKEYVSTKPKYKSAYYASGYPDDGYGVCTDVVAFALRGAGYDLMYLLNEDVLAHRDEYHISTPDKNIDFRRVSNLKRYFERHAVSLTTDVSDIEEWQGGDIVVFDGHIGIISDRRNIHGVPYVIHHARPFQINYEEDILEMHRDILGHFRIN